MSATPFAHKPGWRPRVSGTKNGDWLYAKFVQRKHRPAGETLVGLTQLKGYG